MVGRFNEVGKAHAKILTYLRRDPDIQKLVLNDSQTPLQDEIDQKRLPMLKRCITYIPYLKENDNAMSTYVIVSVDGGATLPKNSDFRSLQIRIDVLSDYQLWGTEEADMRLYLLMQRIDDILTEMQVTSIGRLELTNFTRTIATEEIGGYSLVYETTNFR